MFQVGVVGAALWCVRACVGFNIRGSNTSIVKYFFLYTFVHPTVKISVWRHCVLLSVWVSNAWVSGGVCHCTPPVMQWQWFLHLIPSTCFSQAKHLVKMPLLHPPPQKKTWASSATLPVALFAPSSLQQTGIRPVWNKVLTPSSVSYCGLTFSMLLMLFFNALASNMYINIFYVLTWRK